MNEEEVVLTENQWLAVRKLFFDSERLDENVA